LPDKPVLKSIMKKYKYQVVKPVEEIDGEPHYNMASSLASADPFRYARLKRMARQGDKEALKELKKMENTKMIRIIEVDE
jgi:hypothetical protein